MRGLHSSAILTMMGVTETIASSLDEYIEIAIKLGQDADYRRLISRKIASNKYHIYHDRACIEGLEAFLENAIKNFC
jgi:predicted O-linked N-acetylglucosamine transferase (SPINDLY family)